MVERIFRCLLSCLEEDALTWLSENLFLFGSFAKKIAVNHRNLCVPHFPKRVFLGGLQSARLSICLYAPVSIFGITLFVMVLSHVVLTQLLSAFAYSALATGHLVHALSSWGAAQVTPSRNRRQVQKSAELSEGRVRYPSRVRYPRVVHFRNDKIPSVFHFLLLELRQLEIAKQVWEEEGSQSIGKRREDSDSGPQVLYDSLRAANEDPEKMWFLDYGVDPAWGPQGASNAEFCPRFNPPRSCYGVRRPAGSVKQTNSLCVWLPDELINHALTRPLRSMSRGQRERYAPGQREDRTLNAVEDGYPGHAAAPKHVKNVSGYAVDHLKGAAGDETPQSDDSQVDYETALHSQIAKDLRRMSQLLAWDAGPDNREQKRNMLAALQTKIATKEAELRRVFADGSSGGSGELAAGAPLSGSASRFTGGGGSGPKTAWSPESARHSEGLSSYCPAGSGQGTGRVLSQATLRPSLQSQDGDELSRVEGGVEQSAPLSQGPVDDDLPTRPRPRQRESGMPPPVKHRVRRKRKIYMSGGSHRSRLGMFARPAPSVRANRSQVRSKNVGRGSLGKIYL